METGKFENSFKCKFEKTEGPWGSPGYHKHTVLRTVLCLQNKQHDLQQITGGLDSSQQKLGQTGKKKNL